MIYHRDISTVNYARIVLLLLLHVVYCCAHSIDTYIGYIVPVNGGNWKLYNKETCQKAKENGETRGEKHYNL